MTEVQKTQSPAEIAEAQKVAEGVKVLNTVKSNPFWVAGNIDPLRVENLKSLASKSDNHTPGNINFDTILTDYDSLPDKSKASATMSDQAFESLKTSIDAVTDTQSSDQESSQGAEKKEESKELDYIIEDGNNLSSLARKFDTTIDSIMKLNTQITDPDIIIAGKHLKIHVGDKGGRAVGPETAHAHAPENKHTPTNKTAETKSDIKPVSTVEHNKTPDSSANNQRAEDYQSAVHGTPRGDFGKTRWMHEKSADIPGIQWSDPVLPDMRAKIAAMTGGENPLDVSGKGPEMILSDAKTQIEAKTGKKLEESRVTIEGNKITIPGKDPITVTEISTKIEDDMISVEFGGENEQKHLLTVAKDGILLLDMKPLPTLQTNQSIQTGSTESNTPKYGDNPGAEWLRSMEEHPGEKSLAMEEDNNSDKETLASVSGINGWDGPST